MKLWVVSQYKLTYIATHIFISTKACFRPELSPCRGQRFGHLSANGVCRHFNPLAPLHSKSFRPLTEIRGAQFPLAANEPPLHMGGKRLIYVAFWESYFHGWKVLSLANSRCIRHHMKRFHSKGQMPKNGHLGSLSRRSDSGFECLIRHNVCIQLKVSWPWDWAPKGRPCKNSNVYYFFCLSDSSKNSV